MAETKVFDPRQDSVSVNNKIITDWADGDPVAWAPIGQISQTTIPTIGKAFRTIKTAPAGTITLRVLPDTPAFSLLLGLAKSAAEFPIVVNAQGERISGNFGSINNLPSGNITENAPVREFQVEVLDYTHEATN